MRTCYKVWSCLVYLVSLAALIKLLLPIKDLIKIATFSLPSSLQPVFTLPFMKENNLVIFVYFTSHPKQFLSLPRLLGNILWWFRNPGPRTSNLNCFLSILIPLSAVQRVSEAADCCLDCVPAQPPQLININVQRSVIRKRKEKQLWQ